jgi:small subunit ribosomal protein S8e
LSVWHGKTHKRKRSGGKKRSYRAKKKYEVGSFPTETTLGKLRKKINIQRGGNKKIRLLASTEANVTDPSSGLTKKINIQRVRGNPANLDYDRRGVITKGTLIETSLGVAEVTSRPGQHGIINAILIEKREE